MDFDAYSQGWKVLINMNARIGRLMLKLHISPYPHMARMQLIIRITHYGTVVHVKQLLTLFDQNDECHAPNCS